MLVKESPQLERAQLSPESSRLKIALYVIGVFALLALFAGIATGNYQPLAFLFIIVLAIIISWMWSVAVDRAIHKFRQWNRRHAPQPIAIGQPRAKTIAARYNLREIRQGKASFTLAGLIETGAIPPVCASSAAEGAAERVLALKIQAGEVLSKLATELDKNGAREASSQTWADAASYDPGNEEASAHVSDSMPERAPDELSSALKFVRHGDYDAGRKALESLVTSKPTASAFYSLGVCFGALGNALQASTYLQKAAEAGGECGALRLAYGTALSQVGNNSAAVKQLRAAVVMDEGNAAAQAGLGSVLLDLGELDSARDALEEAVSLDSSLALARVNLGRLLHERGDAVGACREFAGLLDSEPDNTDLAYNYGAALAAAGRFDEIISRLAPLASSSNDPQLAQIVGEAYEKKGKTSEARQYLAKTLELLPESEAARLKLAKSHRIEGKFSEALKELQAVIQNNPKCAEAIIEQGLIAEKEGSLDQALSHFRNAAAIDRNSARPLTEAGRLLIRRNDFREAAAMLKQAVGLQDADIETRYWLGEAHLGLGKALLALDALREAVRESGNRRGDISYAYGRALLAAGRPKEAAEELRRSRKLLPDIADVERDLGYALHKTRNYQEALRCLRSYLSAEPDASDAAEVRRLADSLATE